MGQVEGRQCQMTMTATTLSGLLQMAEAPPGGKCFKTATKTRYKEDVARTLQVRHIAMSVVSCDPCFNSTVQICPYSCFFFLLIEINYFAAVFYHSYFIMREG